MADETPAPLSDADIAGIAERAAYVGSDVWEISEGFNGRIGSIGPIEGYDGDALGLREGSRTADFVAHAPADIARLLATLAARDARLAALERECAALREMLQEAAVIDRRHPNDPDPWFCDWCTSGAVEIEGTSKLRMVHQPDCWYTRARALLADTQTPGQESE